jgi:hypothetical protein
MSTKCEAENRVKLNIKKHSRVFVYNSTEGALRIQLGSFELMIQYD